MSIPVNIEGQKYFVTLPSLADFRTFKQFLGRQLREQSAALIPNYLPDDELKRRVRIVNEECDAIDPFASMVKLTSTPEGGALLFYALLRHENPGMTLDWVAGLIQRSEENKPAALEGLRELRTGVAALFEAKKNEIAAQKTPAPAEQIQTEESSTSTPSTLA